MSCLLTKVKILATSSVACGVPTATYVVADSDALVVATVTDAVVVEVDSTAQVVATVKVIVATFVVVTVVVVDAANALIDFRICLQPKAEQTW